MNKRELKKFFKEAGLNKEQVEYAMLLRQMYRSWTLVQVVNEARNYQPLTVAVVK